MKIRKAIIKGIAFGVTFFVALIVISRIMNKGNNDLTVEMAQADFPVIYMGMDGVVYNELHGYAQTMNTAYMRDTITALNEKRVTEFTIDTYGQIINDISFEVRSVDGERLIENTRVTEYEENADRIIGQITVKDLIEEDTEYALIFALNTENGDSIRYYTRIVWTTDYHLAEKLAFAMSFHEKTFDKEAAQDLAKYMETNSSGDNSTLHKVDIHCSLNQVSWGNLPVTRIGEPVFDVTELAAQTASIRAHYVVFTGAGSEKEYFYVEDFYRLRYTSDRIYLLDYSRTMNSILNEKSDIYVNDKIMLGVEDENLPIHESEDGNVFAFVMQNKLYSYNVTTNKMAVIFGFYDEKNADARTLYNQHGIKVLNIDEGGNIQFAVYGYMNRGRHEGEVGIQVYNYDSALNTIEESLYIPYDKTYQILKAELEQFLYLNRENYLYLILEDYVYEINLTDKTYSRIFEMTQDDSMKISDSNKIAVWQSGGGLYNADSLILMNLGSRKQITIKAGTGEYIMPLGFMGEDLVYGVARREDVQTDSAGRTIFPMYAVYIKNADGKILKTYEEEGIYVSGCNMLNNQITMERLIKAEDGTFAETTQDHIMNNTDVAVGKNTIKAVVTENYGKFIQIAVKKEIDAKSIQILTPKEVLYEGGRELTLLDEASTARYYVYGPDGIEGIYRSPAMAVCLADEKAGVVLNDAGAYVWIRGNRVTRNQIMAIEEAYVTEEKNSLVVCLDTILKFEGVVRNSEYLLAAGETAYSILEDGLENAQILDLKGCSLDAVLYYVNQDIPVLASLQDGSAVLIIGFNEYNIVVFNPESDEKKGAIYKVGMKDATEWLEENGNCFITYIK